MMEQIETDRILVQNVIENLNKTKLDGIFDADLSRYFDSISTAHSISFEILLCPLLTAVSHLMGYSKIEELGGHTEPCIFYSALIASPSTGKNRAINMVEKAINKVENYLNIPLEESSLMNVETVEGLIYQLNQNPCLFGVSEMSPMIIGPFGSQRTPNQADRLLEIYTLYTGTPRFNLFLKGEISHGIASVRNAQQLTEDCLIHKIHFCAPKPRFLSSEIIMNVEENNFSLSEVFYTIYKLNRDPITYRLESEASGVFKNIKIKLIHWGKTFDADHFLRNMIGVMASHILKCSMYIHMVSHSYKLLSTKMVNGKPTGFDLDNNLDLFIDDYLRVKSNLEIIGLKSIEKAINLVLYLNKTKLAMANYVNLDYEKNLFELFDQIKMSTNNKKN